VSRGEVLQAAVRPFVVVIILPAVQDLLGVLDREKVVLRKALSPEGAVERLVHRVVRRFPAPAEVEGNVLPVGPGVQRDRGELRPLVALNYRRPLARRDERRQDRCHVLAAKTGLRPKRKAFPGEHVNDRKHPEGLPARRLIVHKVHGPARIGPHHRGPDWSRAHHRLPALGTPPPPQLETLFSVEPPRPLVIHLPAFAPQQDVQPRMPVADPYTGELPQSLAKRLLARPTALIPDQGAMHPRGVAGSSLRNLERLLVPLDPGPPGRRP